MTPLWSAAACFRFINIEKPTQSGSKLPQSKGEKAAASCRSPKAKKRQQAAALQR